MLRPALCLLVLTAAMAGCSNDPAPAPASAVPAPSSTVIAPPAATPEPSGQPAENVKPVANAVFADQASCTRAGYTATQCSDAQSVASAMAATPDNPFASQASCQEHFSACQSRASATGQALFYPKMEGFSMGSETPGIDRKPSAAAPIFYAPIYKNSKGAWIYTLTDKDGGLVSYKVVGKKG